MNVVLMGITSLLIVLIYLAILFRNSRNKKQASEDENIVVRPLQRGRRNHSLTRRNIRQEREGETEREEEQQVPSTSAVAIGRKWKKKKQAHKEAERERKQALAAAREAQKEKLERERQQEEEEKQERERRKAERLAELERIRREKEELESKEYEKWKSTIQLTEQGEEENDSEEDCLPRFISYIKDKKMVVLEQLALEMNMKTEDVIQRIQLLQDQGHLTGVFDDRGKYIYISLEEMEAVAHFIQSRGRISIKELARRSVDWIQLQ
ncbi:DDRGK domain-containing protein 1 [Galdieria sulphuraria]|nr:DDRGK domain-containing protein 1 [Galdieria sulphuraria]